MLDEFANVVLTRRAPTTGEISAHLGISATARLSSTSSRRGLSPMAASDVDQLIDRSHLAWAEFVKGNPEPAKELFSKGEDVTLGNPFGPFRRGWSEVSATMERAASLYRDGAVLGFEGVTRYSTHDLAYIVEVERYKAKVGGSQDIAPVTLRVTSVLRLEDAGWKIIHRHADPITSVQLAESVIEK